MTIPSGASSSASASSGPASEEESPHARPAPDPAPMAGQSALQRTLRYHPLGRDDPADPANFNEWDRRAYAAQVVAALDTTEAFAAAVVVGDLSALDLLLAPTFCWWSVRQRGEQRGEGRVDSAQTHAALPLEPLATRSTFLALARRWRHAFGDLVISLGPGLIDTEERLLGPTGAPAAAQALRHEDGAHGATGADDAARPGGVTVLVTPADQPHDARRPAPSTVSPNGSVESRVSALVTVSWSATAQHTGTLGRFPATGAVVHLAGVAHLRCDATGQVTHFATTCDTPFWEQLPGLASFAIGPLTAPASARDRRLVSKSHPVVAPRH